MCAPREWRFRYIVEERLTMEKLNGLSASDAYTIEIHVYACSFEEGQAIADRRFKEWLHSHKQAE